MMLKSTLHFNREILIGELGALIVASASSPVVGRLTHDSVVISGAAVAATMVGGSLFWLVARIYDQVSGKTFTAKSLASDVAYFHSRRARPRPHHLRSVDLLGLTTNA